MRWNLRLDNSALPLLMFCLKLTSENKREERSLGLLMEQSSHGRGPCPSLELINSRGKGSRQPSTDLSVGYGGIQCTFLISIHRPPIYTLFSYM